MEAQGRDRWWPSCPMTLQHRPVPEGCSILCQQPDPLSASQLGAGGASRVGEALSVCAGHPWPPAERGGVWLPGWWPVGERRLVCVVLREEFSIDVPKVCFPVSHTPGCLWLLSAGSLSPSYCRPSPRPLVQPPSTPGLLLLSSD